MQIPPSTHLLHALSRSVDAAAAPAARKPAANEAARAAARAVFAQINSVPAVAGHQGRPASAPAVQNTAPALPATPPNKPLPRGSILNILV